MGAIQSVLGAAQLISQGIGLVSGVANSEISRRQSQESQDLALKQLQAQQSLQERQLAAQNALDKEKIAAQTAQSEADRKSALRRAVARQRANFGSQGVGSGTGSSQAVLLGLFDESDAERQKREQLDALRYTALDQEFAQAKSQNVLQRTQLAERNKLDDLASNNKFARNIAALGGLFG